MALFSFKKKTPEKPPINTPQTTPPYSDPAMNPPPGGVPPMQEPYPPGYESQFVEESFPGSQAREQVPPPLSPSQEYQQPIAPQEPYQEPSFPQQQPIQGISNDTTPPDFQQGGYNPIYTERERVEELTEAIIDEKWKELVKDIEKVIEWKENTESRIIKIEEQIQNLRTSIESLNRSIVSKISDYDKNISNVGVEVKAMEKVFEKILPSLTENVKKLERMGKQPPSK